MLTKDLQDVILSALNSNPFVFDDEAEDMTACIAAEVVPYQTTWSQFEEIAYRAFSQLSWLFPEDTISTLWHVMNYDPKGDWGIMNIPRHFPRVYDIEERVKYPHIEKVA
ncbi:MAG: hypothetical protein MJZ82_01950 [Paludibacteraceae bacterium]|nr:hypothetical protein [Paludibacteraceae bacterium]